MRCISLTWCGMRRRRRGSCRDSPPGGSAVYPYAVSVWARMRLGGREPKLVAKGGAMYWHDGWDWVWMTFMMGFWVVVLGAVVYAAVRLAQRDKSRRS